MEIPRKMSLRMRSWYLYEQFKELERNQVVAAEQLREKVDQDRFLRQELSERRERRRLCADSPADLQQIRSDRSFAAASDHSFHYQLQDDDLLRSDDYPQTNHSYTTASTDLVDPNTGPSSSSITSAADEEQYEEIEIGLKTESMGLVDTSTLNQSIQLCMNVLDGEDNDIEEKLEMVKNVIKDNMHLQLDTVRENMKCFEQFTKMRTDPCAVLPKHEDLPGLSLHIEGMVTPQRYLEAEGYDTESVCSKDVCVNDCRDAYSHNYSLWSKLVSFAYQLVQLNHGDILQHYTCPVKYQTDQHSCEAKKNVVNRLELTSDSNRKSSGIDENMNTKKCPSVQLSTKLPSLTWSCKTSPKNIGRCDSNDSGIYEGKVESCYFCSKQNSDVHSSTIWPEEFNSSSEFNSCRTHHTNPMLKLAGIINDSL